MRVSKSLSHSQRKIIDGKIFLLTQNIPFSTWILPKMGWIKSVRLSLGISARTLASIMKIDAASVIRMQDREKKGSISLATLEKAAKAMDCELVYAFIPKEKYKSLDEILDEKAHKLATFLVNQMQEQMNFRSIPNAESSHPNSYESSFSAALESLNKKNQISDSASQFEQIDRLKRQIKFKLDKKIWMPNK